jgi:peptide/nickel transport system permease protein
LDTAKKRFPEYEENRETAYPLRLFVSGAEYKVLGIFNSRQHLFGTGEQGRIFLMGTDAYGRDLFSRLLYGGRISLFAGLLAGTISVFLGLVLGGLAGYYGRWIDEAIMRMAEVFLAMPWLYLLLAVRALLPLHIDPQGAFFLLIGVLGIIGWARPARLVRGIVLTAKEREYVLAARSLGASDVYLLRTHILPFASGVALTQAALYIPQYILAEVTLSFFGLGVSEPIPSWGNMLNDLQHFLIWGSYWWLFAPAIALIAVLLAYYRLFSCIKVNNFAF